MSSEKLREQKRVLNDNRELIVDNLEAEDVIDELIQERLMGRNAAHRVQLMGMSRVDKNRIIVDQLCTAGPGALEKFCVILRRNRRQTFIAEELEKCVSSTCLTLNNCKHPAIQSSSIDASRLRARYLRYLSADWPHYYIKLALVKEDKVTRSDKNLEEITRLTLHGQVDEIMLRKEQLSELKDIFHYQNKPCPRLIVIMGGPGIGKTTLAIEICVQWAKRDGCLAEDFDIVILIPLRSVRQKSIEDVMVEYVGEEVYEQVKKLAGKKCLVILEGMDELAAEHRESDPFLLRVVKECTLLEEATIIITSRPHACKKLNADRRIEVVGFGKSEIQNFVEKSFPNDVKCVKELSEQLNEYPHLESLSYVPMNLAMIIDIFECNAKRLPSTITQLYQLFIVMTLKRQVGKENEKRQLSSTMLAAAIAVSVEENLCKILPGTPKEVVKTLFLLSKLAFRGFFDWYYEWEEGWCMWKDPKIIFTLNNLKECGIERTAEWDGYGLLKATRTHQLPTDTITYSFSHLTIQEFLCAVYIAILSQEEQQYLLSEHYWSYPNVFMFLCGLTGLVSSKLFNLIFSKLSDYTNVVTAVKCLYESQLVSPPQSASPIRLIISDNVLIPYGCLCVSYVLSCYPVSKLVMDKCHIGDKGAELLVKHYPYKNSTGQLLELLNLNYNDFTVDGLVHILKILRAHSASLEELNLGGNFIGDIGISLLSSGLQSNHILTELRIYECGISVKGAICVSKMFVVKPSLKLLHLSLNKIGDDGITAIAEALGNSQISELYVSGCGISFTGARSLAAGLLANHSIKRLDMYDNPVTVEGACGILQSAIDNKVCQEVVIDSTYRNSDEVKRRMVILGQWKK